MDLNSLTVNQLIRECEFYIESLPIELELLQTRAEELGHDEILRELSEDSKRLMNATIEYEARLSDLQEEFSGNQLKNELVNLCFNLRIEMDNLRKKRV